MANRVTRRVGPGEVAAAAAYPAQFGYVLQAPAAARPTTRRRFFLVLSVVIYFWLLSTCYSMVISPTYSYAGLVWREVDGTSVFLCAFIVLLPCIFLPTRLQKPSDAVLLILYFLVVVPTGIVPIRTLASPSQAIELCAWTSLGFAVLHWARRCALFRIPQLEIPARFYTVTLPLVTAMFTVLIFYLTGMRLGIDFASGGYEVRLAQRQLIAARGFVAYGDGMLTYAAIPLLVSVSISTRNFFYAILAAICSYIVAAVDNALIGLLAPVLYFAIGWIFRAKGRETSSLPIALGMCGGAFLGIVEYWIGYSSFISASLVRRLMVIPASLSAYYWEFWKSNPPLYLSDSILGSLHLVENPYGLTIARIVGHTYFGNVQTNANADLWASGFAEGGYAGLLIASVLAGLILQFIDAASVGTDRGKAMLGMIAATSIGLTWTNGSVHTSLLTNGVLLLMVFVVFAPANLDTVARER